MEIEVTPIRKNQGLGKVTEHDASVVIGGSRPDIIDNNAEKDLHKVEKKLKKPKNKPKSSKKVENSTIEGTQEAKVKPNGNQMVTKRKPNIRERVTFTPNKHIKQLIKEIEVKYGSTGKSEFINVAIEAEYNRRK